MPHAVDTLVLVPDDIDLSRSPLAGQLGAETFVLGAFNPALTRLPSGNLLMMVRVAEALREPVSDGQVHTIRWESTGHGARYVRDAWSLDRADTSDPRSFLLRGGAWRVMALTSLSWLLPVELSPDGLNIIALHYDRIIAPEHSFQCYGIEDPRISRIGERWLMTTCSISPERQSTTLYSSENGLDWRFEDIVLDHQNKDMLIFEGLVDGQYWAQTRPLGDLYFAYPPGSEWRAGPSINLATSPDALHWKPCRQPGIRARSGTQAVARMGGGAPPIRVAGGWLSLWHGVEPKEVVGIYRTYRALLDAGDPGRVLAMPEAPLLEANPALTRPIEHQMYVRDVVFTSGIVDGDAGDAGDAAGASAPGHFIVASGEADLACRITHLAKDAVLDGF